MNIFKKFLLPVAWLYGLIVWIRNKAYDHSWLKSYKVAKPVISIGNISVGGSGKTPYILKLIEELQKHNKRPAVIFRGYKRSGTANIDKVDLSQHTAAYYGDEASLVNFKFSVPVYVGTDRVQVAKKLLANETVDLILLDDAFQHRRLQRDLDIVILDATDPMASYTLMPSGRGREPLQNLTRANMIALHKINLASQIPEKIHFWYNIKPNISSSIVFKGLVCLKDWKQKNYKYINLTETSYTLMSGIAKPHQMLQTIQSAYPNIQFQVKAFADHYAFIKDDVPADGCIITEKDAIKIKDLDVNSDKIYVMVNDLDWDIKYEELARKIFTNS